MKSPDYSAVVIRDQLIEYTPGDGKSGSVTFNDLGEQTKVVEIFDAETKIPFSYKNQAGRRFQATSKNMWNLS